MQKKKLEKNNNKKFHFGLLKNKRIQHKLTLQELHKMKMDNILYQDQKTIHIIRLLIVKIKGHLTQVLISVETL